MLVTGEGVAVEMPYASLPSRLIAAVIDLTISTFSALLLGWGLIGALNGHLDQALLQALVVALIVGALLGYPVISTAFTGRTLGKLAMGLRVVRDDGGPIGLREAFTRELAGLVIEKPGALLGFPALVTSVTREDAKRIGDILAGTVVLSTRVPVVAPDRIEIPDSVADWARSLDLSRLSDPTVIRGRTVVGRASRLTPAALEHFAAPVMAKVIAAVGPPPPDVPAPIWLSAVLGERTRREELRLTRTQEPFGVAAWDR